MRFEWLTFGLQLVNVLILLAILQHFLFRPIAEIVARRQAEIDAAQEAADAAKQAVERARADVKAEARKAADTRNGALAAAQADAEAHRKELVAAAQAEAARIVEAARKDARKAAEDARADTLHRVRELAESVARSALSDLPEPPDATGYAKRLAKEIAAMNDHKRRALLSGDRLRLVAPSALSGAETAAAREALASVGVGDVAVEIDPALIAGLDLKSSTGVIHNSLAHDLQRISEALCDGDGFSA